ncbi:uncharacterized protein LOC143276390 [Babylonia areolata]|uniref:uncharacterized protein LOC143276390 n=1 Tax=Babylonia areolata TaxID=304850 RepID=UPI003FD18DD3
MRTQARWFLLLFFASASVIYMVWRTWLGKSGAPYGLNHYHKMGWCPEETTSLTELTRSAVSATQSPAEQQPPDTKPQKPEKPGALTEAEIASRFQQRRDILQSACSRYSSQHEFRKYRMPLKSFLLYKPAEDLYASYCPIQKTGSVTIRQHLKFINETGDPNTQLLTTGEKLDSFAFRQQDVLFGFVRDPYSRLVSAYVDKLFCPSPLFWRSRGQYIVQTFRQNADPVSQRCGHNVTFPEFIKFFIHMRNTGVKREPHFMPTHDHCQWCDYPYKYIGHLETLREDMPFILKAIHTPVPYTKNYDSDTIANFADTMLRRMRAEVTECMELDEACRRLWKIFQIRGMISKWQPFPFRKDQTANITAKEFTAAAIEALRQSGEKSSLKAQRTEVLREAFAAVPLEHRLEVQRLLFLDFELFGFDPKPDFVFPENPPTSPDSDLLDFYFDL